MAIWTFYPESDGELTSASTTWSACRAGTTITNVDVLSAQHSAPRAAFVSSYSASQLFWAFDTSALSGKTPTNAELIVSMDPESYISGGYYNWNVYQKSWLGTLAAADWLDPTAPGTLLAQWTAANEGDTDHIVLSSTADFKNAINTTGSTELCGVNVALITNTAPTTNYSYELVSWDRDPVGNTLSPMLRVSAPHTVGGDTIMNPIFASGLDMENGGWTNQAGSATNLHLAMDEASADDADYVKTAPSPGLDIYQVYETLDVALEGTTDPLISTGHIVRYRYCKDGTVAGNFDLVVKLMQGMTQIASWTHTNITTSWVTQAQTLSGAQADAITNYDDLTIRFQMKQALSKTVTLLPDSDVTTASWAKMGGTFYGDIDDGVGSGDATYLTSAAPLVNGSPILLQVGLQAPPSDYYKFDNTGMALSIRVQWSGWADDNQVIGFCLIDSAATKSFIGHGVSATVQLGSPVSTPVTLYTGIVNSSPTLAELTSALIQIRMGKVTSMGNDPINGRIMDADLTLAYVSTGDRGLISWAQMEIVHPSFPHKQNLYPRNQAIRRAANW